MDLKNVTMKDIAKYTGVSTATVSRVLNDNYPVNIETKKKVLKAIEELNYEPNLVAKNLRSRKSNLVAIIVADIKNPYYVSIAKEIDDFLFEEGYNLITCSTDESLEKEATIIRLLLSKHIDGIVIAPSDSGKSNLTGLIEQQVPIVLVDRKTNDLSIPFVGTSNFKEAYNLTEYLINKGHEKIAVLTGKLNTSTGKERLEGFKMAMANYGLVVDETWIFNGDFDEKQAYEELSRFLKSNKDLPTALVSCNNLMTKGTILALNEENINIPEDISIVSFGAMENQELFTTRITCIEQDTRFMGRKVAELLLAQLKNKQKLKSIIVESTFIEGNSVKEWN
ncbi:LacI family DNA-binding transcriptional regulator [Neobacillus jeddahensis]|uniref:LacI family DNA-binding transcriptional regulator n=1 Tax=Neobacillus jeddahensis TaxID=1461580 RepID=UPI000693A3BB|nr:LacI family DNA-binding transcriptional regulator [Neobacillus jeddahensis]